MFETSLLLLFLPTSFFISITPGLCMTLAMSLGMTIGVRRTLYMMMGELIGVSLVAIAAIAGVAAIMLNYPAVFTVLKWCGGAYLGYVGLQMWLNKGKLALSNDSATRPSVSNKMLFSQGFITAVANPKGWVFMMSLLPPFINPDAALAPQLSGLLAIMLCMEFLCMVLYASGGRTLKHLLGNSSNIRLVNRVSGSLMIAIGLWLALG